VTSLASMSVTVREAVSDDGAFGLVAASGEQAVSA
jgi:hypothetical protein